MAKEDKVALEVCEPEFQRMCAGRRIDTDVDEMSEAEKATFERHRDTVLRAMRRGHLVVNGDGDPEFTPPSGNKVLKFARMTAATLVSIEKADGNNAMSMAATAEMTGTAPSQISKLDIADFKVCGALAMIFLGAE